jgi:hypothetical protein
MEEILVDLVSPTNLGRMRYSESRSILKHPLLFIESAASRKTDYAIVINGGVIVLMFDRNGILINVEFACPHHAWNKNGKYDEELPVPSLSADLKLTGVCVNRKTMVQPLVVIRENGLVFNHYEFENIPIEFCTDSQFTFAKIVFDNTMSSSIWITLSEDCMALVSGNYLKGFFINLGRNSK